LHCWNLESLETIGNALGKYIDTAEGKDQFYCARICVEVYLETGLPEVIKLNIEDWFHIHELDYERLPFKCRHFHEYGHFARHCNKKQEETLEGSKGEQWQTVQRNNGSKPKPKQKGTHSTRASPSLQAQIPHQTLQTVTPGQGKETAGIIEPTKDKIPEIRLNQEECEEGEINQEQDNNEFF